jgi:hypothetical protein
MADGRLNDSCAGVIISEGSTEAKQSFMAKLEGLALDQSVDSKFRADGSVHFSLRSEFAGSWTPHSDTTQLSRYLDLDINRNPDDFQSEILLAMLTAPQPLEFSSVSALLSNIQVRQNIVAAACRTQLAFHTSIANRPEDCWTYDADIGFKVLPDQPLILALQKATQPGNFGTQYAFSCYRATEYVILLAIAQEADRINSRLHGELQTLWQTKPFKSAKFHDVFLHEYGSMISPLPSKYYIPGDRVWFRNPDEKSSDVSGYEGSWVFYLGGGMFSNFWKRDCPYTLTTKCIEIYHWRDAVFIDDDGEPRIDESVVEAHMKETMQCPDEIARIMTKMNRMRGPRGVYAEDGCIDVSREFPKSVCPGIGQIVLPTN